MCIANFKANKDVFIQLISSVCNILPFLPAPKDTYELNMPFFLEVKIGLQPVG
jgi:hypothetical protein